MELDQVLEDSMAKYLEPYLAKLHSFSITNFDNLIEIKGQSSEFAISKFILIRVIVAHQHEEVQIPNIHLPKDLRHNGIGLKLISVIYEVVKEYGYTLAIIDLTEGFRERLLRRGALQCSAYDVGSVN